MSALLVALALLGACSGADGRPGDAAAPSDDDPGVVVVPTGITEDQLDGVDDCEALHDAVLEWLDAAAARAVELIAEPPPAEGDADDEPVILELLAQSVLSEDGPTEGLEPVEGLFPAAPYGGIAGGAAAARYEELGCRATDEFPALLAWFGLEADTPLTLDEGSPLGAAALRRMREDGAGGFVALGLVRRLGEGAALPDSPLMAALADVARAQEAYRADAGTYADDLVLLRPYLEDPTLADEGRIGPVIIVTAADADAYCVHGADGPSAVVESHDGVPRNRIPGTPSCPNTFPDLDER